MTQKSEEINSLQGENDSYHEVTQRLLSAMISRLDVIQESENQSQRSATQMILELNALTRLDGLNQAIKIKDGQIHALNREIALLRGDLTAVRNQLRGK